MKKVLIYSESIILVYGGNEVIKLTLGNFKRQLICFSHFSDDEIGDFWYNPKDMQILYVESRKPSIEYNSEEDTIHIPEGVTNLNPLILKEDNNYSKIELPESLLTIRSNCFCIEKLEELRIPDSVIEIQEDCITKCNSLKRLYVGKNNKKLSPCCFSGAKSLEEVVFDDGIVYLPMNCFSGDSSLVKVKLPDTLEVLQYKSFELCSNLSDMDLPDSVKIIESGAFACCDKLVSVRLPQNLEYVSRDIFDFGFTEKVVYVPERLRSVIDNEFFVNCIVNIQYY